MNGWTELNPDNGIIVAGDSIIALRHTKSLLYSIEYGMYGMFSNCLNLSKLKMGNSKENNTFTEGVTKGLGFKNIISDSPRPAPPAPKTNRKEQANDMGFDIKSLNTIIKELIEHYLEDSSFSDYKREHIPILTKLLQEYKESFDYSNDKRLYEQNIGSNYDDYITSFEEGSNYIIRQYTNDFDTLVDIMNEIYFITKNYY